MRSDVQTPMFCVEYGCPNRAERRDRCKDHQPKGCGRELGRTTWGGVFARCRPGMLCLVCDPSQLPKP